MSLNILFLEKHSNGLFNINIKKQEHNLAKFIDILSSFRRNHSNITIYKEEQKYLEVITDYALNLNYKVEEFIMEQPANIVEDGSVRRRYVITDVDTLIEGNNKDIAEIFVDAVNINSLISITNKLLDKNWNISFNWLGCGENRVMSKSLNPLVLSKSHKVLVQEVFTLLSQMKKDNYPIVNKLEYLIKFPNNIDNRWHCVKPGLYFLDINGNFMICPDIIPKRPLDYTEQHFDLFNDIWLKDENRLACSGCYWKQCVEHNIVG